MKEITVEGRIERLEQQLKVQRWIICALLLGGLAVAGIAAATSDVSNEVRTKKLVIVNDKNEQMISMMGEKDGGVAAFFNGQGLSPVMIAAGTPNGGELLLKNQGGVNQVEIGGDKSGTGRISVFVGGKMRQLAEPGAK